MPERYTGTIPATGTIVPIPRGGSSSPSGRDGLDLQTFRPLTRKLNRVGDASRYAGDSLFLF
jgi:hypothetical protein